MCAGWTVCTIIFAIDAFAVPGLVTSHKELFQKALSSEGNVYRQAARGILRLEGARELLTEILNEQAPQTDGRYLAKILLARHDHEDVFDRFRAVFEETRKRPDCQGERPGYLSGELYSFVGKGPERKFVREPSGSKYGGSTGRVIEKYTDEEVRKGRAHNAAARLAALEHFLKFADEDNEYEQNEMLYLVYRLWGSKSHERRKDEPNMDDLIERVLEDENKPLSVRVHAVFCLPENKRGAPAAELMLRVARDDSVGVDWKDYGTVRSSLYFLQLYGDKDDLAALQELESKIPWKQALIDKTREAIRTRLSKTPGAE